MHCCPFKFCPSVSIRTNMHLKCLTWYPIVLERHHSKRICLMLLALDTPKLWERFNLGLESTGLGWLKQIESKGKACKSLEKRKMRIRLRDCRNMVKILLPVILWIQSLKNRPACLGPNAAGESLWPHQLTLALNAPAKGQLSCNICIPDTHNIPIICLSYWGGLYSMSLDWSTKVFCMCSFAKVEHSIQVFFDLTHLSVFCWLSVV